MKAIILTEGGKGIGLGHITRCLSIYEEFKSKGLDVLFAVNQDSTLNNILTKNGIPYLSYNGMDDIEDIFTRINPDIVLIDSYSLDLESYSKLSRNASLSIAIDDYNRIDYPVDIVVNSSIHAKECDYLPCEDKVFLLGPEYFPKRSGLAPGHDRIINKDIEKILITFGGDDSRKMTPRIIKKILSNFDNIKIEAIIGPNFSNTSYIDKFKSDKRIRFVFNPDIEEISSAMLDSDIAISAGGQTLYELAITGTPGIGIGIAENQRPALEAWHSTGLIRFAGWHDDADILRKMHSALKGMKEKHVREKASEIGINAIDGNGAKRIAKRILHAAKEKIRS